MLSIRSSRVLLPSGLTAATLVVRNGRIDEIAEGPSTAADIDAGDLVVMPGLVDTHVHVNEPGRTDWEGFASATRAAAAGGVTTIVDMPLNSIPATTTAHGLLREDARGGGAVSCGRRLLGRGRPGECRGDRAARPRRRARLQVFPVAVWRRRVRARERAGLCERRCPRSRSSACRYSCTRSCRRTLREPAGDPRESIATWLRQPAGRRRARGDRSADRPRARVPARTSTSCTSRRPARWARCARARAEGVSITAETCPHYLTFAAEDIADGDDRVQVRAADSRARRIATRLWQAPRAPATSISSPRIIRRRRRRSSTWMTAIS